MIVLDAHESPSAMASAPERYTVWKVTAEPAIATESSFLKAMEKSGTTAPLFSLKNRDSL